MLKAWQYLLSLIRVYLCQLFHLYLLKTIHSYRVFQNYFHHKLKKKEKIF